MTSASPTILISINTSWNIYHFRAPLIHVLRAQGYRVVSAAPDDAYTARLTRLVDQHVPLPMQNAGTSVWQDMFLWCRYIRLLRALKPAMMLTYTIKPTIYGALAGRLLGIPVIATMSGLGTAFIRQTWLTTVVKCLYRIAFRGCVCVFFQNAEDRDLFVAKRLLPFSKTALLAGSGVDLDYFQPCDEAQHPDAPLSFVLIARMLWDKGIGEYVAAARIIKASHPQVKFRLVGPTGVHNKTAITDTVIAGWVNEGIIDYLGPSDAVREVIAAHDCVVLPSYREGLSRVLLEAAAMGKPLIATDVPGCRQVVEHEKNGLLCSVRDADGLAAAMQRFLQYSPAQRKQMGAHSRAKAEREFDEKKVLAAYVAQIAAILT